jgi:alpha-mannosidase
MLSIVGVAAAVRHNTHAAPKKGILNVHIVPHTHDDVGWLKTVDEYYTGQNNSIQHAGVRYILDSVIRSLAEDPERKFVYAEQAFFQRWWAQQATEVQELTRRLVRAGQLQFINGGWCMHDEAAPHYVDMIDQTTLGHRLLLEQFNVTPTIGWQIDPFGHSATQAALLSAEVGFDGLFFGRIDYQDLALRTKAKAAEFIWRASPSLGPDAQVFAGLTGEYGGNYGPPSGFNWDVNADDEPVQDDSRLTNYNVKSRVDDFVAAATALSNMTQGEHVMFTMGSDFQYEAV